VNSIKSTELVVDGQQRLSTIVDYIQGNGDFSTQEKLPKFSDLNSNEKKDFLNYFVSVRDLKDIDMEIIKDVFQRINNTEYSLNAIEKANAQYGDGEFIIFNKQISDSEYTPSPEYTDCIIDDETRGIILNFFTDHHIFTDNDMIRMNNLQLSLTLTSTLLEGSYFGRNTRTKKYIKDNNESFDNQDEAEKLLLNSISIYHELDFENKSYWFFKPNFFTLMIEFSKLEKASIDIEKLKEKLLDFGTKYNQYFSNHAIEEIDDSDKKYFEYAREGFNAKAAREYRGEHIRKIINACLAR
jgi:hypothetical protein